MHNFLLNISGLKIKNKIPYIFNLELKKLIIMKIFICEAGCQKSLSVQALLEENSYSWRTVFLQNYVFKISLKK